MHPAHTSRLPAPRRFWLLGVAVAMLACSSLAFAGMPISLGSDHKNASDKHDKAPGHEDKSSDHDGKSEKHDEKHDDKKDEKKDEKHDEKKDDKKDDKKDGKHDDKHDKSDDHSKKGSGGLNIFKAVEKAAKDQSDKENNN